MNLSQCSLKTLFLILLLIQLLAPIRPAYAAETIVLVGSRDTKESFHGRWLTLIYDEVFKRLGHKWVYEGYASPRASSMSDSGEVDGEINRVSHYGSGHPNVIRVEESHFPTALVAYAITPGIKLNSWEDLRNTDYYIEYRRGTKIVKDGLEGKVQKEYLSTITQSKQGLQRLMTGRTDIYIDVEDLVIEKLLGFDHSKYDTESVYKAGYLAKDHLHLYLHKKRASLVKKISRVLRELKQEGLIEEFKRMALPTNEM